MSDHENTQAEESADDVAGHGKTMPKISDDTSDTDDVAGHGKTMPKISDDDSDGPGFVTGALGSDDSLPSSRAT